MGASLARVPARVSLRAHVFQHVPFEGPGSIAPWLEARGTKVGFTRFFQQEDLPNVTETDFLIVLGGPMSANDEGRLPWLVTEKRAIGDMINRGKPVLGVCLGAQLIANVLGSAVYRNPQREIGWFPIHATHTSGYQDRVIRLPATCQAFHWHGETFDLPDGAVRLAKSAACQNQAFQYGTNVIGLQFHLETTPASARDLVTHCREDLVPAEYIQSEAAILAAPAEQYATINGVMSDVLAFLLPGLAR